MLNHDLIRVHHMLDAATEALAFASDRTRAHLEDDRMLVLSLVKSIEIIGEAAARVSVTFRAAHPEIPWAVIVAMRNRLIHAYFDVDLDRVWDTIVDDLPPLVARLERLLAAK